MQQYLKGVALVLLSAFGFGMIPIFALYAYQSNINVTTLLLIRFTLAAVIFLVYVLIKHRRIALKRSDLFYFFLLGGVCYTLQSAFYFSAVRYIAPSLASLLLYTYPLIVVILATIIDRDKPTRMMVVSAAVSFVGVLLILGTSYGRINGTGIVLALSAALVYSTYIIMGNRVLKSTPPLITSTFVSLFAGAGILVVSLFTEKISFAFAAAAWLPALGLVFFSTIIGIFAFFRGIEILGPARASILSMTEPLFTTISAVILLQDRLTPLQAAGGIAVLTGAVLITRARHAAPAPEKNATPG
ncbi:MAG TPA: DMT family transporter [Bacillota bacterium]|nr:DMT family transporter [Bacillota bacterium]